MDVYFGMPGEISEHEGFLRAKMDLEERRMRQINEVMILGAPGFPTTQNSLNKHRIPQAHIEAASKDSSSPQQPLALNITSKMIRDH